MLIAGFAAADALRGNGSDVERATSTSTPVQTTPTRLPGPEPQADAPAGWPTGALQGSLVFTNASDCRVRVIGLAGGRERPLARFAGACDLWAPPVGERIAYSLGPSSPDGFTPFKIADLSRPNADLGGYRALFGVVLWSPDGQRIAWCGRRRTGFDLEIGGAARRLPECPAAYTAGSRIAYAVGRRLIVHDQTLLTADGGITFAKFLFDGSIVVDVDGERIVVYDPHGRQRLSFDLPRSLQGRTPIMSPDGCAALFREGQQSARIRLLNLGCFQGDVSPSSFPGSDAAWSPDGRWIAVAGPNAITFHQVLGGSRSASWPARAAQLAWGPR